ncbi:MAG: ATP-dependent DNA helicase [Candidatus Nanopelagicales bacterium]
MLVLDRTPRPPAEAPDLDAAQRRVVAHRHGPLLVLAGPGTGKTTTLVESIVARLSGPQPLRPEQVLGLTFGRRAAAELRDRVLARVGGGAVPTIATFHSYCYGLVRQWSDPEAFASPLRLLSGAEQEQRLRELLVGSVESGRVAWPAELGAALGTRGLAAEVRAVLARGRGLGFDPDELARFGREQGNPAWAAVGEFAGEYLDVLDAEGVTDYTELVHRALLLASTPHVRDELRRTYRAIYVDEYQDTDPAQVALLRALAGPDAALVVVGDPDQAIYAFRGADVGGLLRFRSQFAVGGEPAPVEVLDRTRRFGPVLRAAASRVLGDRVPAGLDLATVRRHRAPASDAHGTGPGSVQVLLTDDAGSEAAWIADLLRRAHLGEAGDAAVPWSQMAVLVRSGVRQIPGLRRALTSAGIPVEVAGDEIPLHEEPAVAPLLAALSVAADRSRLTVDVAEELLLSPLGGLDPTDLRRLGRLLRRAEREVLAVTGPLGAGPRPSAVLVREALDDPRDLATLDAGPDRESVASVRRLADLLHRARAVLEDGGSPHDALWVLWSGTGWGQRLEEAALRGGPAGRRADRDLDAVCALMDAVERAQERAGVKGATALLAELASQQIPAGPLAEAVVRGEAVRLLTAHRAKGLEWRLVVVAGVQEDGWPDLRRRGSFLQADRIGRDGLVPPPRRAELLGEERRLFYVACTRARERLVVTAVQEPGDDGEQPSRFVADLLGHDLPMVEGAGTLPAADGVVVRRVTGRPARPLTLAGLVAELRATATDPDRPAALREAAVQRLARLAAPGPDGRPRVMAADPASWWGLAEMTPGAVPVRPPDQPVKLSGSALERVQRCPLQWFLSREVRAESSRSTALGFGSVLHVLADRIARGEVAADLDALDELLDPLWPRLSFEARWHAEAERVEARAALARLLAWSAADDRTLVGTEVDFDVALSVPRPEADADDDVEVRIRGSMDRVSRDGSGRVHVDDLKTGRRAPTAGEVRDHVQLGVYQVAVRHGALGAGPEPTSGASLVQLRLDAGAGSSTPKVQSQPALDDAAEGADWVEEALGRAAVLVLAEDFAALPGPQCDRCEFRRVCPTGPQGTAVTP